MGKIEKKIEELGLVLPQKMQVPEGMEILFPEVNVRGDRAFVSGCGPLSEDGQLVGPFGKVGQQVTLEQAVALARLAGLAMLGGLQRELGSLDRITGWGRVFGMVNAVQGFARHPMVINGASRLILDVFGDEVGQHARSAVGVFTLPMRIAVEIEAEVLIKP